MKARHRSTSGMARPLAAWSADDAGRLRGRAPAPWWPRRPERSGRATPVQWSNAVPPRGLVAQPDGIVIYEPALGRVARIVSRLGSSRTVVVTPAGRVFTTRAVVAVGVAATAGMLVAQPFDPVSVTAPLWGLVAGGGAGAGAWLAVRGRHSVTVDGEAWMARLDAVDRVLRDVARVGQPFISPTGVRAALHSALWHAALAEAEPGGDVVIAAFDAQVAALGEAAAQAAAELEHPVIEARTQAVTDRLGAATSELSDLCSPPGRDGC